MAVVSQWIERGQLVHAIMGIHVLLFVGTGAASQGPSVTGDAPFQVLPLAGYDFTEAGRDGYGTQDLTLFRDANTVYDLERGPVLQLGGSGYALAEAAHLAIGNALTLCYWIREDMNCPDTNVLVGQGWDNTVAGYTFAVHRVNKQKFEWCISSGRPSTIAATHRNQDVGAIDVSDGQWHHIAVTYDAQNVQAGRKIYVDGQLDKTLGSLGPVDTSFSGISVGHAFSDSSSSFSPFVGRFDDIGFYDTSLTQAQVQQIMTKGLSGYNPELPVYVSPLDGAQFTRNGLTLVWQAGQSSASHNVYLSQDREAVATQQPEALLGQQTVSEIEVTGLDWDATYYWRIDEVNEAREDSPWLGPIWSFTTLGTRLIDDIESYWITSPNRIFESWLDRWPYTVDGQQVYAGNGTGMVVGEYNDQAGGYLGSVDAAYEGWFSLPLEYDNTQPPYYSETQRNFEGPMDWTTNGHNNMAYLCLQFLGTILPPSKFELSGSEYHVTGVWSDNFDDLDDRARLNKTDYCTFVSIPMQGNGAVVVKVESLEDTAEWARAGIMIRDGLDENARHMAALVTPSNRAEYLVRQHAGGDNVSRDTGDPNSISVPHWLRLTRQGGILTADHSVDGERWDNLGTAYMVMAEEVQVGLMVNSFVDDKTPCQAVFSNLQVNGSSDVTLETLTNIGRETNDPDHLYLAVRDARGQDALIVHPDDPNALLVDQWRQWCLPLSELQAQGVDLTQITELAIGVGDTPKPGASRGPGGRGKFYVDQIRLMAGD
ncbi:MAG: DUF1349 domain-containing protein [Planctomycetes bacterium]|nr:DUF1349 domain-containing protein [Planctomycetota bacterium]